MTTVDLRLRGPVGEPVDLVRTLNSHGFVDLPPMRPSADYRSVELTLRAGRGRPQDGPHRVGAQGSRDGFRPRPAGVRTRDGRAHRDGPSRPAARRRPLRVLRGRVRRSRPRVGDRRGRAHGPEPDGVRGRRQDDLHDQLRVVGHHPDGPRDRRAPRRAGGRRPTARSLGPGLPDARGDGRSRRVLLQGRRPHRVSRRVPPAAPRARSPGASSTWRRSRRRPRRSCRTRSSRSDCSRCPGSGPTRPPTS